MNRFQYAFPNLEKRSVTERLDSRIFHAPIRRIGGSADDGAQYRIELFAGDEYLTLLGRYAKPWTVVVDHSGWTNTSRAKFERDYFRAVTEARTSRRRYRLHVLGDQNPEQWTEILVDRPSRIYIISER